MPSNKQWDLEFRYYDMPQHCPVLCLYGDKWRMLYGGDDLLHFHNILEIGICREGSGRMMYPKEERAYGAGNLSIIPKNRAHSTESDLSWWEYVFIDSDYFLNRAPLSDNAKQTLRSRIECRSLLLDGTAHPQLVHAVETILAEDAAGRRSYTDEIIASCCLEILYFIARENRDFAYTITDQTLKQDQKIRQALEFIELNYARHLTVGEIAESASMSETNFRRVFHRIMNMPPNDYLNMVRIRHACSMLTGTDQSVEMIAEACGFTTSSTFNRNFRQFLQMTPLKWRKNAEMSGKTAGVRITAFHGWGQEYE